MEAKGGSAVEHYWLCSACASTMTLAMDRGRKVLVIPRRRTKPIQTIVAIAS